MGPAIATAIDFSLYGLLFVLFMVFFGVPSIEKYQRKDTIIVTSKVSTNGIEAPAVSIVVLSENGYGWKANTSQTSSLLGRYNMAFLLDHCKEINLTDVEHCIAKNSFELTDFMTTATFKLSPSTVGELDKTSWTEDVGETPDGRIFTWNPQRIITPDLEDIVFLSVYKNFTYFIFVHDIDFYIIGTNPLGATPAFWTFNGKTMQNHYHEIALVKHKRLNLDHQPCEADENYRILDCVKKSFAKQVGCRLPWDKPRDLGPRDKPTIQDGGVCTTRDQFKQFDTFFKTSTTNEIDQVKKLTGCLTPCSYKEYKFLTSVPKTLEMPLVPDDQIAVALWGVSRNTEIKEEVFRTISVMTCPNS